MNDQQPVPFRYSTLRNDVDVGVSEGLGQTIDRAQFFGIDVLGVAGDLIKEGQIVVVDLSKGPNQLLWPDDGKEITIELEKTDD